jgi:hypothetical protein
MRRRQAFALLAAPKGAVSFSAPEKQEAPLLKNQCAKCLKVFVRGWFMHQKHCKG